MQKFYNFNLIRNTLKEIVLTYIYKITRLMIKNDVALRKSSKINDASTVSRIEFTVENRRVFVTFFWSRSSSTDLEFILAFSSSRSTAKPSLGLFLASFFAIYFFILLLILPYAASSRSQLSRSHVLPFVSSRPSFFK